VGGTCVLMGVCCSEGGRMLIIVVFAVSCVVVRGWNEEVGKWVGLGV